MLCCRARKKTCRKKKLLIHILCLFWSPRSDKETDSLGRLYWCFSAMTQKTCNKFDDFFGWWIRTNEMRLLFRIFLMYRATTAHFWAYDFLVARKIKDVQYIVWHAIHSRWVKLVLQFYVFLAHKQNRMREERSGFGVQRHGITQQEETWKNRSTMCLHCECFSSFYFSCYLYRFTAFLQRRSFMVKQIVSILYVRLYVYGPCLRFVWPHFTFFWVFFYDFPVRLFILLCAQFNCCLFDRHTFGYI